MRIAQQIAAALLMSTGLIGSALAADATPAAKPAATPASTTAPASKPADTAKADKKDEKAKPADAKKDDKAKPAEAKSDEKAKPAETAKPEKPMEKASKVKHHMKTTDKEKAEMKDAKTPAPAADKTK